MKTYLLFLTLLLCVSLDASAQETEPEFKHDIGINTFIVINGLLETSQTPFSLMYKTYNTPNRATRLGISLNFSNYQTEWENPAPAPAPEQQQAYANISLIVGREFQRNIAKKWILFYGADLVPQYGSYRITEEEDGEQTFSRKNRSYSFYATPFLGVRFNVAPMLYLSVEASASLGYSHSSSTDEYANPDTPGSKNTAQGMSFRTNPITGIFMYYRF